jgi:hypothetical protein
LRFFHPESAERHDRLKSGKTSLLHNEFQATIRNWKFSTVSSPCRRTAVKPCAPRGWRIDAKLNDQICDFCPMLADCLMGDAQYLRDLSHSLAISQARQHSLLTMAQPTRKYREQIGTTDPAEGRFFAVVRRRQLQVQVLSVR